MTKNGLENLGVERTRKNLKPSKKQRKILSTDVVSLTALQQSYGIPPQENLTQWTPFRSDLVDLIYMDDNNGILRMYETAEEVINVYERENLTMDDFVVQLSRIMREAIGGGGGTTMST